MIIFLENARCLLPHGTHLIVPKRRFYCIYSALFISTHTISMLFTCTLFLFKQLYNTRNCLTYHLHTTCVYFTLSIHFNSNNFLVCKHSPIRWCYPWWGWLAVMCTVLINILLWSVSFWCFCTIICNKLVNRITNVSKIKHKGIMQKRLQEEFDINFKCLTCLNWINGHKIFVYTIHIFIDCVGHVTHLTLPTSGWIDKFVISDLVFNNL